MKAKKLFPDISFRRLVRAAVPVDNLESTDTDRPLSANMGREVKEQIDENTNSINELDGKIDEEIANHNHEGVYVKENFSQNNRYIHYDLATLYPHSSENKGVIKIGLGLTSAMTNIYVDIWSYLYRGMIIAGGYTYAVNQPWYEPNAIKSLNTNLTVRFANDASYNKYILIGDVDTNWGGYLGSSISKAYSHYQDLPDNVTMELVTDISDLTVTKTF